MHILEEPTRLSQSLLWSLNRDFYEIHGTAAWSKGMVPLGATSSAHMAHAYARVVLGLLEDLRRTGASGGPLHVVEMCAGPGRLGYRFVRALAPMLARNGFDARAVRYVLTDGAAANVAGWQKNPRLAAQAEAGLLDFALFDPTRQNDTDLAQAAVPLSRAIGAGPVVVIGNYAFDVLPHDCFTMRKGVLHEVRLRLALEEKPAGDLILTPDFFQNRLMRQTVERAVELPYYNDAALDDLVRLYADHGAEGMFHIPVYALAALRCFEAMSGGRMLVLIGDMARATLEQATGRNGLGLALNGSFSSVPNLHALMAYARGRDGRSLMRNPPDTHFDTYVLMTGRESASWSRAADEAQNMLDFGPPGRHAILHNAKHWTGIKLSVALAILRLSHFDPLALLRLKEPLLAQAAQGSSFERDELRAALKAVAGNHFPMGEAHDLWFLMGRIYRRLEDWDEAIACFKGSLEEKGEHANTHYNIGLCYKRLNRLDEARTAFDRALALAPNDRDTLARLNELAAATF